MSSTLMVIVCMVLFFLGLVLLAASRGRWSWFVAGAVLVACLAFTSIYHLGLAGIAIGACLHTDPERGQIFYHTYTDRFVRSYLDVQIHVPKGGVPTQAIFLLNHMRGGRLDDTFRLPTLRLPRYRIVHRPIPAILGSVLRMCGGLEIQQNGHAYATFENASLEVLGKGESLLIYPEGGKHKKSGSAALPLFGMGAFVLSFKTGMPIVPILTTSHTNVQSFVMPGSLVYHICEPCYPSQFTSPTQMRDLVYTFMRKHYIG